MYHLNELDLRRQRRHDLLREGYEEVSTRSKGNEPPTGGPAPEPRQRSASGYERRNEKEATQKAGRRVPLPEGRNDLIKQRLTTGLDFEVFRRAIEKSDAKALADLYADDAEVRIVDRNSPPGSPFVLRGKEAVAEYLRDSRGNGARHQIENEVLGEGRVAFNEARDYPDGTRVLAATTLGIKDGRIVREVSVEVWDE